VSGTAKELEELLAAARADFGARIGARLLEIEQQSLRGDWAEARRSAHRLRGSAATYGFATVGEEAARMEEALMDCANGPPADSAKLVFSRALASAMKADRSLRGLS
jgi:HPt (histidine-containing phosphotransfer) domain-containing protein